VSSLFWRIFLAVWVAVIGAAVGSAFLVFFAIERNRDRFEDEGFARRVDTLYGEARAAAERGGLEGLRDWARATDRAELMPILVVDEHGEDVLGRRALRGMLTRSRVPPDGGPGRGRVIGFGGEPPPPEAGAEAGAVQFGTVEAGGPPPVESGFVLSVPRDGPRRVGGRGGPVMFSLSVPEPVVVDGRQFAILPDPRSLTLWRVLRHPSLALGWLAIACAVSAAIAWPLTRSIVRPIPILREATRAVSGGYLGMRVAPLLDGRRDELGDLARDFDAMSARVEELLQSQRQLLMDMSHELRSPLARMFVALELARKRAEPGVVAELDRVERETRRLTDIIEKILTLGRVEAQRGAPAAAPLDLDALLAELCTELGAIGPAPVRHTPAAAPLAVAGEAAWLRAAFSNVIQNAQRYTREGSAVEVRATADNGEARVVVRDHGPGVPPEMLERIFEPFVRVSAARERDSGGYGLGLAIVKRVCDAHGGRVAVRNAPDGGLEVELRLTLVHQTPHGLTPA
jgi:signal transduction histidine kinase